MVTLEGLVCRWMAASGAQLPLTPVLRTQIETALREKALGPLLRHDEELRRRVETFLTEDVASQLPLEASRLQKIVGSLRSDRSSLPPCQWLADGDDLYGPLVTTERRARFHEWELRRAFRRDRVAQAIEEGRWRDRFMEPGRSHSTASSFGRHHTLIQTIRRRFKNPEEDMRSIAVVGAGWDSGRDETYEVFEWAALLPGARVEVFDRHQAISEIVNGSKPARVTVNPAFLEAFPNFHRYLKVFGIDPEALRQSQYCFEIPPEVKSRARSTRLAFTAEPFPARRYALISFLMTYAYLFHQSRRSPEEIFPRIFLLELFHALAPGGILVMDAQFQPPFSKEALSRLGMRSWIEIHDMLDIEKSQAVPTHFTFFRRVRESRLLEELARLIQREFERNERIFSTTSPIT